jgi:hypothetical protein
VVLEKWFSGRCRHRRSARQTESPCSKDMTWGRFKRAPRERLAGGGQSPGHLPDFLCRRNAGVPICLFGSTAPGQVAQARGRRPGSRRVAVWPRRPHPASTPPTHTYPRCPGKPGGGAQQPPMPPQHGNMAPVLVLSAACRPGPSCRRPASQGPR